MSMIRPSNILWVISLILLFTSAVGFSQPGRIGDAKFLSPLENAVVHELNMARTAPKDYSSFLEQYKKYYDKKLLKLPGQTPILTNEGVGAVVEAIRFLRSVKPLPPLNPSKGMSSGARDHVTDQGPSGSTQHEGSDGSQPWDRVNRYGTWEKSIGENIAYGSDKARSIVMFLIIDDGVSSRGHRKNIFNPDFRVIGVACGHHATYRTVCVITFAGGYKEKSGK
ncbi:MAG: CAP domain-containing protein [Desulfobacterales bacterium]|nr:CAP domain-containing protein [Desulfobacterales bacterium]